MCQRFSITLWHIWKLTTIMRLYTPKGRARVRGRGAAPLRMPRQTRTINAPATYRGRFPSGSRGGGGIAGTAAALALRYGPSAYRLFRRRRKQYNTRIQPAGAGSTTSYFSDGRRRLSRPLYNSKMVNQVYENSFIYGTRLDSNTFGRQYIFDRAIPTASATSQFTADLTLANGAAPTANQLLTASLNYGTCSVTSTFTNCELTTSYLTLYEVVPRFHIPGAVMTGPKGAWAGGLDAEIDSAGTWEEYVYESPFRSSLFTWYYVVKKSINIELPAGGSHKHVAKYYINHPIRGGVATGFACLRGFNRYLMTVVSGTPINDATTTTLVSTSTVAIDMVSHVSYDFWWDSVTRNRYVLSDAGLGTIAVTPKVITDKAVTTDAEA